MEQPFQTRAVVVPLDPTPAQAQLLRSYCGSARYAYNWIIGLVMKNLDVRTQVPLLDALFDDTTVERAER